MIFNMLKRILNNAMSLSQSALTLGRLIASNIIIAFKVVPFHALLSELEWVFGSRIGYD